ncbi:efflux RND transporter periplasmic adaptor subunit [Phenylobacterium sp. LjRoot225]|uniref:efflux RND transporter periplasmic adaptor subunit n=1 Tax=Phenylobacterium sp. LjRoot225 TaxID=3342285 RepID=UPI003ED12C08
MRHDRTRLYGAVAGAVLVAGLGGFGLARLMDADAAAAPAEAAQAHHEGPEGAVVMSADQVRASGIVVQAAAAGGLAGEIIAQATVAAAPDGQAVLTARATGAVTRIHRRIGDSVRAGEVLAVVESREAAQLAADRTTAAARANLAHKTLARERRLFEQRVSARQDYEQAEAEAAAANAEVRRARMAAGAAKVTADGGGVTASSPIAGRITAAPVTLGAFVQPETELFRVTDPSRLQIEAAISGADAPRVRPGDRAIVETADGQTLQGRVRAITPALDPETGAATATLDLPAASLQPGQQLRARIVTDAAHGPTTLIVPEEAVQSVDGRDVVFVRTAQGFQARPVTVRQRSAGRAEIVAGLAPGQAIAIRNAFLLKAELGKAEGGDAH